MKINSVELRVLKMRLLKPFRTSFGVQQERYPLLVRLDIDGRSQWGECVAGEGPWYSYETVETAWQVLKGYLLPAVIGRELANVDALETLFAPVRGHHMAKACIEMAFTAALAEHARKPLATFLGGVRDRVETGVSIGIQPTVDELLTSIGAGLSQGYRRIKVKIEPGWDVMAIGAIRERYPEITLMADANAAYGLDDAAHLAQLDRFAATADAHPHLPGREHRVGAGRTPGTAAGGLSGDQCQARSGRWLRRVAPHPRHRGQCGRTRVVRRHARDGHRSRVQRCARDPPELPATR